MSIVLEQVAILFIFMLLGYIFGKKRLIDPAHSKILSTIAVYIFLPCKIFNSFSSSFNLEYLTKYYPMIIISVVSLIIIVVVSFVVSKVLTKNDYEQKIYRYSLIVPNYAYMGYGLAEGLFGASGLLNMIIVALPVSVYIYTFGFAMLTKKRLTLKRLFNPVILAMLLGAVVGLLGLELPNMAISVLDKASACLSPIGMILCGLAISEFDVKSLVTDKKTYIVSFLRLVAIPLLVLFALKPFCSEDVVRSLTLLYAMPCGLNTIIFAKLVDEDCYTGAKLAFVSSVLSLVTIPIILSII